MDPAERVMSDIELTGIVTDDDRPVEKAARFDALPERAFAGDKQRIGRTVSAARCQAARNAPATPGDRQNADRDGPPAAGSPGR